MLYSTKQLAKGKISSRPYYRRASEAPQQANDGSGFEGYESQEVSTSLPESASAQTQRVFM